MAALVLAVLLCYAVIIILTLLTGSEAISCVICDSRWDPECATNPLSNPNITKANCSDWCNVDQKGAYIPGYEREEHITGTKTKFPPAPCPKNFTSCRTIYQETSMEEYTKGYPEKRVFRRCGFLTSPSPTLDPVYTYRSGLQVKHETVTCFKDLCNTAKTTYSSCNAIVFLLFAYFIS